MSDQSARDPPTLNVNVSVETDRKLDHVRRIGAPVIDALAASETRLFVMNGTLCFTFFLGIVLAVLTRIFG